MGQFDEYPRSYEATVPAAATANTFINRVYGWMCGGLALTAAVSYGLGKVLTPAQFVQYQGFFWGALILDLVLVSVISLGIRRLAPGVAALLFAGYAALNGVTLGWLLLVYTQTSVVNTFLLTSGTFGLMSLYGYLTRSDLTRWGNLLLMGLLGLVLAMVVNLFLGSSRLELVISCVGVLIFVGLTAYDTQKLKQLAIAQEEGAFDDVTGRKYAILGALTLYLDFINLFLLLLRFTGRRR